MKAAITRRSCGPVNVNYTICFLLASLISMPCVYGAINIALPGGDRKVLATEIEAAFDPTNPIAVGMGEGKVCNTMNAGQFSCGSIDFGLNGRIYCHDATALPASSLYTVQQDGLTYLYQRTIQADDFALWGNLVCPLGASQGIKIKLQCNNGDMFSLIYLGLVLCFDG